MTARDQMRRSNGCHLGAIPFGGLIAVPRLEEFSRGLEVWGSVDAFAGLLAGAAWLRGQVPDDLFLTWARSPDRWLRRAALASTAVLNTPSHGGIGDVPRTVAVCELLVDDRDDMVVEALSWALGKLVDHDRNAVRQFLSRYDHRLAARVRREVRRKLATGRKNPSPVRRGHSMATGSTGSA